MINYREFSVYTTHTGAELIADLMWNYTDSGVVVNDIQDALDLENKGKNWDYIDNDVLNRDKTVIVTAYFPIEKAESIIKEVTERLIFLKQNPPFDLGTLESATRDIDGDLWRVQWKERFKPIHVENSDIVIVPEWIEYSEKPTEKKVLIDSNMAFGTGEHETTAMCIEYLSRFVKKGDTVLDVGCGSGILGISAKKLGANKVIMTDIDAQAVETAKRNIILNRTPDIIVLHKNLLDDNKVKGDIIAINIMAEVLIYFSPYIANNLNENGLIILSGILADRLEKVKKAYLDNGFTFVEQKIKGEWSALVMKKV